MKFISTAVENNYLKSSTETEGNNDYSSRYNRKTIRYAKKHKITEEEAFRRIYEF